MAFGERSVKVIAAEDDLERAVASHQIRQPVHGTAYRDQSRTHLDLRKDGSLQACEPDVTRQGELRTTASSSIAHGWWLHGPPIFKHSDQTTAVDVFFLGRPPLRPLARELLRFAREVA